MRRSRGIMRGSFLSSCVLVGLVSLALAAGPTPSPGDKPAKPSPVAAKPLAAKTVAAKPLTDAQRDVRAALAAELAGDSSGRNALLAQALQEDPNCTAARWQLGYARVDGKWLSPYEAESKYSVDRTLTDYRRRRDELAAAGMLSRGEVGRLGGGTEGRGQASQGASVLTDRSNSLSDAALASQADLARWCRTNAACSTKSGAH